MAMDFLSVTYGPQRVLNNQMILTLSILFQGNDLSSHCGEQTVGGWGGSREGNKFGSQPLI